jgi:thioredoxin 2
MSDSRVVCPHCHVTNQLPAGRLADQPRCGKCHEPLFGGGPAELSGAAFERHLARNDILMLVDFWAPWCGPCRMVEPIVEELAEEYGDKVKFLRMNTDDNVNTASQYGIRAIPTLLVFKGGQPVGQVIGFRPKSDLKKVIDQALSS